MQGLPRNRLCILQTFLATIAIFHDIQRNVAVLKINTTWGRSGGAEEVHQEEEVKVAKLNYRQ